MDELKLPVNTDKKELYKYLTEQVKFLTGNEKNMIANMANVSAAIRQTFGFLWVGFYLCENDNELVLGPFQGAIACTRIKFGHGVCGAAWKEQRSVIVADVDKFPGHIACNSASKSEIVIPLLKNNKVFAVLDIDSDKLNTFDDIDRAALENMMTVIIKN
ncbi:MAG: GAF domain-containing protein [Prevotellaceae bacterium]|jgi:GAF domain-containing protein|nr:GAF domain-containing protein [Prevotellaceae bacterium]